MGRFGIVATLAANEALLLRDTTLEPSHFAEAIRLLTLCSDEENVFMSPDWPEMPVWPDDPQTANMLARTADEYFASDKERRDARSSRRKRTRLPA